MALVVSVGQEFRTGFTGWFWLRASPGHGQNVGGDFSHVRIWPRVEGPLARCLPHEANGGTPSSSQLGPGAMGLSVLRHGS